MDHLTTDSCGEREFVILAIYPQKTDGRPVVNVITSTSHDNNLSALNNKLIDHDILQCERIGEMTQAGYCYLLLSLRKKEPAPVK